MKVTLPKPEHDSYIRHRKQRSVQILLPAILGALLFVVLAVLVVVAAARGTGDITQWGAVSAILIMLPLLVMGLIFVAVLAGSAYLFGRLLGILPVYTGRLQDLVYRIQAYIKHFADLTTKPVFAIDEVGATLKALFGRR